MNTLSYDECNILKSLNKDNWNRSKKLMIHCILNTDNAKHFENVEIMKKLTKRFEEAKQKSTLIKVNNEELKYIIDKKEEKLS